jgi:hypothetical protein
LSNVSRVEKNFIYNAAELRIKEKTVYLFGVEIQPAKGKAQVIETITSENKGSVLKHLSTIRTIGLFNF